MREALQDFADQQVAPHFHSLGIAKDVGLQSVDVEDWLKANWRPDEERCSEPDPYPE